MVNGALTYFAMVLNLVSRPIALVPWTLPGPIGAYMATGFDWRAAILSIINIIISVIIYYPFFKVWDKKQLEKEMRDKENEQCKIEYEGYVFEVLHVDNNIIQKVRIAKI